MITTRNILVANPGVNTMTPIKKRPTRRKRTRRRSESLSIAKWAALQEEAKRAKQAADMGEYLPATFFQPQPGDTLLSFTLRSALEIGFGVMKFRWKGVAPISYQINRAVYAIAPQRPVEDGPALNLIALGTGLYGLRCVLESK